MSPARVRTLLADDHALVRAGVRKVLESRPGLELVGEAATGADTLRALETLQPDLLVLDLNMPDGDGFAVLSKARDLVPEVRILVLTMHDDPVYVGRAIREGADGYVLKDLAVSELLAAVESVMAGRPFYSASAQSAMAQVLRHKGEGERPIDTLTPREREVLIGVARGQTTKEIASDLNISTRTVESHRASLMRKLEVRSVALLTQLALREGLIADADAG